MNRAQRRASEKQSKGVRRFKAFANKLMMADSFSNLDASRRYLLVRIRPMTVADLVPGHSYVPGMTILEIEMPAGPGQTGELWHMPVQVPEEMRAPTEENARAVYTLVYGCDPQARDIIESMKERARPWHEVEPMRHLPREFLSKIIVPPAGDAA